MRLKVPRIGFWMVAGVALVAILAAIVVIRFKYGLGAVTNLSDSFPWGLWIGFDILCGVGLAAGGFAITATVHVLHLKDFKPIVRPTVLTAFLGYGLVIVALLIDLGRPWNIWHPLVMWNPHSVMFEIAWCVMLYTSVLLLEFSPTVLEKFRMPRALKLVARVSPVLVILGVILSTLHQSSLGSMFLIMPSKVHPLWYSPVLPVLFFVSALAAGLAMTVVESWFSRRAMGRPLESVLLVRLSRTSVVILALFLAMRLRDLWVRGVMDQLFALDTPSIMALIEIFGGVALPMVLLMIRKVRHSPRLRAIAQGLVVLGFIFHRLNVSVTAVEAATGVRYIPSLPEFLVSMGLMAVGILLFMLASRYLPVFEPEAFAVRHWRPSRQPAPSGLLDKTAVNL